MTAGPSTAVAIGCVVLAVALLYRRLTSLRVVSYVLWTAVIGTIGWVLVTALVFGHWAQAFTFPPDAFRLTPAFFSGLAGAMLIATYDFWGYYNVTFLGAEVRDPGRTIPRAILWSIVLVAVLYLLLNTAILTVIPWQSVTGAASPAAAAARQALVSTFMLTAYGGAAGIWAGRLAAILVMIAAFASIFSLLLGYSRIPFAAARDGNFFTAFGRLHPRGGFPYVALLTLGGLAALCCLLSLAEVIAALVILRIVVQFLLQQIGVMWLRRTQPGLARPFRLWLYPLPPLLALAGFTYILLGRAHFEQALGRAAVVVLLGSAVYLVRERLRSGLHPGHFS